MTLINWKPNEKVFTKSINEFLYNHEWGFASSSDFEWSPPVDIEESHNSYNIKMDIPGLLKKDIKVTLFDNELEISGSRKNMDEADNKYFNYHERGTGSFKRKFNTKNLINESKITATFKNGLLEIILPKVEKNIPEQKKIRIN
jgi:HSP20 family protein